MTSEIGRDKSERERETGVKERDVYIERERDGGTLRE